MAGQLVQTLRPLLVGLSLAGWIGGLARAADPAPNAAQVDAWIADLDSEQFLRRETATQRLIQAGAPAIEPLAKRAASGSLEAATRAVHILRELSLHDDPEVEEAAREGLTKIAAATGTSAARRAEAKLASLNETRQRRAIDELTRLGAKVGAGQVQFGLQAIESVLTLEIGPDWRGELRDLRRLKWLVGIQQVRFTGDKINDQWLEYLAGMNNLTSLTIKRASVTDKGLAVIRELPKLQSVWIMYVPIGDDVVEHLQTLKQAAMIKLYGTKITKEAATRLQESLANAKIDYRKGGFLGVNCQAHPLGCEVVVVQPNTAAMDAGLQSSDVILKYGQRRVESFETLTTHIAENLPGEEVTLEIVRNARLNRNGLERAADAKLGITGKSNALGIEIATVVPNSFAAQLDLKPGDVITACDEKRVFDLEALEAAYAASKPGEKLNLDYVRAAVLVTKKVTLGAWE